MRDLIKDFTIGERRQILDHKFSMGVLYRYYCAVQQEANLVAEEWPFSLELPIHLLTIDFVDLP